MDLQALTFIKLAEGHLAKFSPEQEDQFYQTVPEVPQYLRKTVKTLVRAAKWLRHPNLTKLTISRSTVRKQKAKVV